MNVIRKSLTWIYVRMPRRFAGLLISSYWKLSRRSVTCSLSREGIFEIRDKSGDKVLYVNQSTRLPLYSKGISPRLYQLIEDYWLSDIKRELANSKHIICIDIGANIGEVSQIFHEYIGAKRVFSFEPEKSEYICLVKNTESFGTQLNFPLWKENAFLEFFSKNQTGDSSLIRQSPQIDSVIVEARSLDDALSSYQLKRVDIMKLEAEGAEPEIVEGATETLKKTRFVTADLGPEQGLEKMETFSQVNESLSALGFKLVKSRVQGRKVYLFENMKLH